MPDVEKTDLQDKDDEQPQIVVLKKGDLSEDEVNQLRGQLISIFNSFVILIF